MKKALPEVDTIGACSRLKQTRLDLGFKHKNAFANLFGLNPNTYQNYERDRMPPTEFLAALKSKFGEKVNIDFIVSGDKGAGKYHITNDSCADSFAAKANPNYSHAKVTDLHSKNHHDIIDCFRRKEMARNANLELVAIEQLNPTAFSEVVNYIKGIANGLRYSNSEKLLNNQPDVPDVEKNVSGK